MSKPHRRLMVVLAALAFVLAAVGCHSVPANQTPGPQKTAHVLLSVVAARSGANDLHRVPLSSGTLDVNAARVYVGQLSIQENSGCDSSGGGSGVQGGELDQPDIVVNGPFDLDIAGGSAFIDTVAVYPGVFRKTNVGFAVNDQSPYTGMSILISGVFTPDTGSAKPFALRSAFANQTECGLVGDSIVVQKDTTVSVSVVFNARGWLSGLDFAHAQLLGDSILIDANDNPDLLAAFEAALSNTDEGGNGENGGGGDENQPLAP
jgi:hypothetical protein